MALSPTQDAIVLFGDSLTQGGWEPYGFAQRLASAYVRKFDVINRGFSGYQTDWAIPVLEQLLAKKNEQNVPRIQLLTIWYGANDAATPPSLQHVPRDRFKANLTHLVNMVKSPTSTYYSPDTRVILITPPPVNTFQWQKERIFAVTKSYAEAVKEVGEKVGVPVADVWTEIWEAAGRDEHACERFLYDGLHLNAAGYEIIFNSITRIIQEKYPEIHEDKLQAVFIPWSEVNVKDPRSSLAKRSVFL